MKFLIIWELLLRSFWRGLLIGQLPRPSPMKDEVKKPNLSYKPMWISMGQEPTAQAGGNSASPSEQPTCFGVITDITPKASDNLMGTLRATGGGGVTSPLVAYAFDTRQSFGTQAVYAIAGNIIGRADNQGGNGVGVQTDKSYTLTTTDRHAVSDLQGLARQLTPIECERLMGFHDNYTKIAYRGKPAEQCPKSQRYKALGNSMAVPVMRWIGERIVWALNHQE